MCREATSDTGKRTSDTGERIPESGKRKAERDQRPEVRGRKSETRSHLPSLGNEREQRRFPRRRLGNARRRRANLRRGFCRRCLHNFPPSGFERWCRSNGGAGRRGGHLKSQFATSSYLAYRPGARITFCDLGRARPTTRQAGLGYRTRRTTRTGRTDSCGFGGTDTRSGPRGIGWIGPGGRVGLLGRLDGEDGLTADQGGLRNRRAGCRCSRGRRSSPRTAGRYAGLS